MRLDLEAKIAKTAAKEQALAATVTQPPPSMNAPFVLTAKKILQDLCKMKLGWLRKYLQSTMYVGEKIACRPSYAVKASDQPLFSTSQLWDHRL